LLIPGERNIQIQKLLDSQPNYTSVNTLYTKWKTWVLIVIEVKNDSQLAIRDNISSKLVRDNSSSGVQFC
jgi:hypothetical protein